MRLLKYTLEQLQQAIKSSTNYRQTLAKLNVIPAGGNYQVLKKAIKYFNLDIAHFNGAICNKGKIFGSKRPITDYLNNTQTIQSNKLRKRLLKDKIFEHKCSSCNLTSWLDVEIPLELDHINGNPLDNSLSNLRLLCPNCHALTSTYRGKNKK